MRRGVDKCTPSGGEGGATGQGEKRRAEWSSLTWSEREERGGGICDWINWRTSGRGKRWDESGQDRGHGTSKTGFDLVTNYFNSMQ